MSRTLSLLYQRIGVRPWSQLHLIRLHGPATLTKILLTVEPRVEIPKLDALGLYRAVGKDGIIRLGQLLPYSRANSLLLAEVGFAPLAKYPFEGFHIENFKKKGLLESELAIHLKYARNSTTCRPEN